MVVQYNILVNGLGHYGGKFGGKNGFLSVKINFVNFRKQSVVATFQTKKTILFYLSIIIGYPEYKVKKSI